MILLLNIYKRRCFSKEIISLYEDRIIDFKTLVLKMDMTKEEAFNKLEKRKLSQTADRWDR